MAVALHVVAVEILIEKAKFERKVALGIAEAIEASIMHAQLVTVPILDARLQELKSELKSDVLRLGAEFETKLERTKAELVRWVFLVMLGNVALTAGATAMLNAFRHFG
jgi:hypothetical protein